jgi:hypothetical protein
MTTKALQITASRILATLPPEHKDRLRKDIKSEPEKVKRWVSGNISGWAFKTALENPNDSATTRHTSGLHEGVEVYSPDLAEDGRLLIMELTEKLCTE